MAVRRSKFAAYSGPVIRSARSDFDVFVSSLPDLATRVGELVAD